MLTTLLLIASQPKIATWLVGYNPDSLASFKLHSKQIDTVFTEYYTIDKNSKAVRREAYKDTVSQVQKIARRDSVEFFVMVNNYATDASPEGFESSRMTTMLASEESRVAFAKSLVIMVKEDKAQGLDLDFESLKAADRDRYSKFVTSLGTQLHKSKLLLSVTVHPKQDDDGGWDGTQSQDYAALGKAADRLNVMTYDNHWADSEPGPIAGNAWVKAVMTYAKSRVAATKLSLGVACYGYDWSKKPADSLTYKQFPLDGFSVDALSGERVAGKARFGAAESFKVKLGLASDLGVRGVAFWYCGSEDPGIWDLVGKGRQNYLIDKESLSFTSLVYMSFPIFSLISRLLG